MSEFPECMKRRGDEEDERQNGQVCHRIVHHGGSCLFDRPAEFEPAREPANFRTGHSLKQWIAGMEA